MLCLFFSKIQNIYNCIIAEHGFHFSSSLTESDFIRRQGILFFYSDIIYMFEFNLRACLYLYFVCLQEGKIVASQQMQKLMKDHNISPLKSLYGLAQVPVFLSFFFALRAITGSEVRDHLRFCCKY